MKFKLQDLIDINHFQILQDRLNELLPFPSSIVDNDGKILTASGWQEICTNFHRKNNEAEHICVKISQYIKDHLHEANPKKRTTLSIDNQGFDGRLLAHGYQGPTTGGK
jgi:hypothetical protein